MSNRRKKSKPVRKKKPPAGPLDPVANAKWLRDRYMEACIQAERGHYDEAQKRFERLQACASDTAFKASLRNDLAVLLAVRGDMAAARTGFQDALALDPACGNAKYNIGVLDSDYQPAGELGAMKGRDPARDVHPNIKVAIVSFLFN